MGMGGKRGSSQSPRKNRNKNEDILILKNGRRASENGRRRAHAPRLPVSRSGCYNPEVRRGVGAVIFVLGFPTAIAGIIMTVVDADDNEEGSKYPAAFAIVGPILIVISIFFLVIGFILSTPAVSKALMRCFSFDDPRSFCRVYCPRFSQCIKPDDIMVMNQHAMNALKSEPSRSVLKKQPQENKPNSNGYVLGNHHGDVVTGEPLEPPPTEVDVVSELRMPPRAKGANKGVRFSESDADDFREARTASVTSSDNGSVLSLRNFKVHPKADCVWSTGGEDAKSMGTKSPIVFQTRGSSSEQLTTEF